MIENYLAFTWLVLMAFFVIMYVISDGLDLGTGILFSLVKNKSDRDTLQLYCRRFISHSFLC